MVIINENEKKTFRFDIEVDGADLDKTFARIVFESAKGINAFPVTILENGNFGKEIEYPQVKGFGKGKIYLEVLAENHYFRPWEDKFIVTEQERQQNKNSIIDKPTQVANSSTTESSKKTIVAEDKKPPIAQPAPLSYLDIKREYKRLMKKVGVMFMEGDTKQNLFKKGKVIALLEKKYGNTNKNHITKIKNIKIDELIIS